MVNTPSKRQLTYALNAAYTMFGYAFLALINNICPNLTVCPECRIDDFCHFSGCKIIGE